MKSTLLLLSTVLTLTLSPSAQTPALGRVLPPFGDKITAEDRSGLIARLGELTRSFQALPVSPDNANAEIFLKAVRYALDNDEFYQPGDAGKARDLLAEAERRIADLAAHRRPWLSATGFVVRGYYSPIDDSPQPFGLEIPENNPKQNAPAWFWLQGRGDKRTDLHFLAERMKKGGEFNPPGTIIVHPWGRYCIGYKGPGEQDVLDVRELLIAEQRIDPARTALAGFSMGGAGAWLLGAHFTDHWAVIHTGAGFVDVRRYQKYTDSRIAETPPWERTLWGQNDVPDYVRNLLNVPVISYSGEKDAQRASAEIMAGEFQKQGATLTQHIGPGMGHKYHPEVRRQIQEDIQQALLHPVRSYPLKLSFQTRTLDYSRLHWLQATGLEHHWQDSRIDAELDHPVPEATTLTLNTSNISSLRIQAPGDTAFRNPVAVHMDGQALQAPAGTAIELAKTAAGWTLGPPAPGLRKLPGLQGPVDDAFNGPFLFVLPDKPGRDPELDAWIATESAAQLLRWKTLFRGDARVKPASAVTPEDIKSYHLILWGDPASNALIAQTLPKLPLQWNPDALTLAGHTTPAKQHLPVLIYPNPLNPERYLVLNSGPTWREAHSKTNSQQNPKLPDWALLDISSPPTPEAAGTVEAAGFFNESWGWAGS